MPKAIRKITRRNAPSRDAREHVVRYFTSAGRIHPEPPANVFIPFADGERLREDWTAVRSEVRRRVARQAFELLSAEFDQGLARTFYRWPQAELDHLRALTAGN